MKTSILFIILFFSVINITFSQSSLKFNQTFSSREISKIKLDISNPNVEVKSIKGSIIVVETSIEISSTNYRLLEFITNGGRYNLSNTISEENGIMTIVDKKKKGDVYIKDKKITEKVFYTIFIPESKKLISDVLVASK